MNKSSKRFLAVVAVLVLLFIAGIRIGHPQGGLSNSLGPANSSLVLYRHGATLASADKAMVKSGNPDLTPALGVVASVGKDYYDVNTGTFLEQISKTDVQGKLIVVIPFFGYILNIIGL